MMRRAALLLVFAIFFAHLATLVFAIGSAATSNIFVFLSSLLAALLCHRRSIRTKGPTRRKWDFVAIGIILWALGQAIYTMRLFFPWPKQTSSLGPEFYFLVYGVPLLLAISSSNEDRDSILFVLVDSFQAIFAVGVTYIQFVYLRFASEAASVSLNTVYAIETWILALAVTLRLMARPRGEERSLYRILSFYLWTSAVLATLWNGHPVLDKIATAQFRDLLWDFPFLVLTLGCALLETPSSAETPEFEMNSFALLLNNGSPILFTLAVLAMGASIARHNFRLGISVIVVSLVIYCFRAALLQSAYIQAQHALTRSQHALREANSRLKQLSLLDALTGVPNRRQFDQTLDLEWNRALRGSRHLSMLIIDVDCFKALNDCYGHQVGDDCLARVASTLQDSLRRAGEVLARYGGEEFAAILPNVDLPGAIQVAEAMRQAVFRLQIINERSLVQPWVTVSIGVATMYPGIGISSANLISAADEALYRAKRNGRDRVETAELAEAQYQRAELTTD